MGLIDLDGPVLPRSAMTMFPHYVRVLDLFAGLRGWSRPWADAGHDTTTLDLGIDGDFDVDFRRDILDVASLAELERGRGPFDVLLASPPCTAFSVAAMGKNWERDERTGGILGPKRDDPKAFARAELGMRIAQHTFLLVDEYRRRYSPALIGHPIYYVIENPVGALRVMPFVRARTDRRTTWYCRWGETRAKPTDLWTNIGGEWPVCRQGGLDHDRSPRGSKTGGTQGLKDAKTRSLIPAALADAVMIACLTGGNLLPMEGADAQARLL